MAQKSLDKQMETETTIRWDDTTEPAVLWTASASIRKEWESYGFPIEKTHGGWRSEVPKNRITYKVMQKQAKK